MPVQASTEIFFRNSKFWKGGDEAPPVFLIDGVSYLHLKVSTSFLFKYCRPLLLQHDTCCSMTTATFSMTACCEQVVDPDLL